MSLFLSGFMPHLDDRWPMPKPLGVMPPKLSLPPVHPRGYVKRPLRAIASHEQRGGRWHYTLECGHKVTAYSGPKKFKLGMRCKECRDLAAAPSLEEP